MIFAIQSALRRMRRHPIRVILTVLQTVLGAFALTLALNVLQGRQLTALPPDVFQVVSGSRSREVTNRYSLFRPEDLPTLKSKIPDAETIEMFADFAELRIEYQGQRYKIIKASRVGSGFVNTLKLEMLQGGGFPNNNETSEAHVVIAQSISQMLFGQENPIGKSISVLVGYHAPGTPLPPFEPYQVIGVFKDPTSSDASDERYMLLPLRLSLGQQTGQALSLIVKSKPGKAQATKAQALEAIRDFYQNNFEFKVHEKALFIASSKNMLQDESYFDPQVLLFTAFSIILLIACSVGVLSIQLVEIAERTKETGMRRALGATRNMVIVEVLANAFVFSITGAIIGVVFAAPVLNIISNTAGPFLFARGLVFSNVVALEVVAIMLLVGVGLGFYPAYLASRLQPVEALREA